MNIPKRIADIIDRKDRMLEAQRAWMDKGVIQLQQTLFNNIIEELIPKIDVSNGLILENEKNFRLLTDVDKLFSDFQGTVYTRVLPAINKATDNIFNLSKTFFEISLAEGKLTERFEKIVNGAKKLTDLRLGLDGGKVVRGGFLWSLVKGGTDNTQFKQFLSRAITSQMNIKDFITATKELINGTDVKAGLFDRQFKRYAYDVFQQYDAAYNKKLSEEFDLKYFIYQGGLVKDSRDFCIAHNDKVFSIEESDEWRTWTPQQSLEKNEFPEGYTPKDNLYQTPSYMNYDGYDPLVDRGGYNCRHILAYITDNLAEKLRPDLKGAEPKKPKPPEPEFEEYEDLGTIKEAENYARKELGIDNVSFNDMSQSQMPIINEFLRSIQNHLQRFPFVKMELDFVGSGQEAYRFMKQNIYQTQYDALIRSGLGEKEAAERAAWISKRAVGKIGKNTWAESINYIKGIGFNKKWSVEVINKHLKECVVAKWHPTGCDTIKSIIDHEMGHRLDMLLNLTTDKEMQEYFRSIKAVAGKRMQSREYFKNNLSTYAWSKLKNSKEFIAESWSEYLNNPQPREIARKVGEMIEKKYKDRFGKQLAKK